MSGPEHASSIERKTDIRYVSGSHCQLNMANASDEKIISIAIIYQSMLAVSGNPGISLRSSSSSVVAVKHLNDECKFCVKNDDRKSLGMAIDLSFRLLCANIKITVSATMVLNSQRVQKENSFIFPCRCSGVSVAMVAVLV